MEDVPRLPDEHLEKAKEIIRRHRSGKSCRRCYDRGYQGVNQLNMVIICHKCVDEDKVTAEWQAYVRDTPALAEAYGDYFETEEEPAGEEGDADDRRRSKAGPEQRVREERGRGRGGTVPHRSVGR